MPVILVVEDEVPIREMIAETVTQLHYDVRLAATAVEALTMAKSGRPDAILLDIALPDASGTSTLDQLRKLRPDVPIIMLTANSDEELARETLKRGAYDYIVKPFNVQHLARVLEAALAS
jgi:DNA-binding response OmpR family regulator